jgi:hypothetical protein
MDMEEIKELVKKIEDEVALGRYPRELFEQLKEKIKEKELMEVL